VQTLRLIGDAEARVILQKIRERLNRPLEMLDRGSTIIRRCSPEYEPGKKVATAQVLFIRGCIVSGGFGNTHLLGRAKLNTQPLDDALGNRILQGNDV